MSDSIVRPPVPVVKNKRWARNPIDNFALARLEKEHLNPLPEAALIEMLCNLERSLGENPRTVYVLYHNPLLEHVLGESVALRRVGATENCSLYSSR